MTIADKESATIAIISSNAFDYGPSNFDSELSAPAGEDFAKYIEQKLFTAGATRLAAPVAGNEGWTFDIDLNPGRFRIFVHWAPIGEPPVDRWVIQPDICKSLLKSLFGRRTVHPDVLKMVSKLHHALEGSVEIDEIRWISKDEFSSLY